MDGGDFSRRQSPVANRRRASSESRVEKLVVSEKDFKKHGGCVEKLRKCQLPRTRPPLPPAEEELERTNLSLALSFKSAFRLQCLGPADTRDEWEQVPNPEGHSEAYRVGLNQVWIPETPRKARELQLRAAQEEAEDAAAEREAALEEKMMKNMVSARTPTRTAQRSSSRRRQQSNDDGEESLGSPGGNHSARGRPGRHGTRQQSSKCTRSASAGGISRCSTRPGSEDSQLSTPPRMPVEPRIRPVTDDSADDLNAKDFSGRFLRYNTPEMRRHTAPVKSNTNPHAVWLSINPRSGEISVYSRPAARRLEGAYVYSRRTVQFANLGLGPKLEDAVVDLGNMGTETCRYTQITTTGGTRDVKRAEVPYDAAGVTVDVVKEGRQWRLADATILGVTERRWSPVSEAEMVDRSSASDPVHHQVKRGMNCFINEGAHCGY